MRKCSIVLLIAMFTLLIGGCSGKFSSQSFLREDVDLDLINRLVVLPFENHTDDKYAAQRVRDVAITQVLAMGISDVVDMGIVDSVMMEEVIDPGKPIDLLNLKRLAQRLNVEAFLLGSIDESGEVRKGTIAFPDLAVTLRLVDSKSSVVIWQSSARWSADSMAGRLFGLAPTDKFHITLKLMKKMLSTIPAKK
ncbi:MAG: hypothetical protein KKB30_08750 [Proteobacteria bacterium]|nr:hypothetical protein [Pseudomonadota bacterium]MBU1716889.1 hypothetical protein [Pseudomonadota bacterium]